MSQKRSTGKQVEIQVGDPVGKHISASLFIPSFEDGHTYPLVVYLHGMNNGKRVECGMQYSDLEWQSDRPCLIYAPDVPQGPSYLNQSVEQAVLSGLFSLLDTYPIDRNRIYLVGVSTGAVGAWRCIARCPHLFAAIVAIGGAANPYSLRDNRRIPVWAFHAADDPTFPVTGEAGCFGTTSCSLPLYGTRDVVRYLRGIGNEHIRYTEYRAGTESACLESIPTDAKKKEIADWLFAQTLQNQYEVQWLRPGLWRILDGMGDCSYLVEGERKALLIDTGMSDTKILPLIRQLTKLPLLLAVTHAHGDHMANADEFDVVYLHAKDLEILPQFVKLMMPNKVFIKENFTALHEGDQIDLGGVSIEVFPLEGHTPGSVVLIDTAHRCLFTGDAIGSGIGVLMSIPGATKLSIYRASLYKFRRRLVGIEDFVMYGGHCRQEHGENELEWSYHPLCPQLVDDMISLCDKLINGDDDLAFLPCSSWTKEQAYQVRYRTASMWVCKSQIG